LTHSKKKQHLAVIVFALAQLPASKAAAQPIGRQVHHWSIETRWGSVVYNDFEIQPGGMRSRYVAIYWNDDNTTIITITSKLLITVSLAILVVIVVLVLIHVVRSRQRDSRIKLRLRDAS
jgi:sensor c-di-GMP phosphodiesterase-like protein